MAAKTLTLGDLPIKIPVFPLSGALLLPRGQLPLNVFEPRYLQMLEDAFSRGRYLGIIQPLNDSDALQNVGCLGRITSFSETEDGRMIISVTGICRFRIANEMPVTTPYRQLQVEYQPFADDLTADAGALDVRRDALLDVLQQYLDATGLSVDWDSINNASNETLVNSLSMISPYGPREKQALLEATSLSERNEILIALTEMALAQGDGSGDNDNAMQ
jgi:Lon protease-like protein